MKKRPVVKLNFSSFIKPFLFVPLLFWVVVPISVWSQEQEEVLDPVVKERLADIRIELQNLDFKLQVLRWELVQTDNEMEEQFFGSETLLDRLDEIENEIRENLNKIELIEYKINNEVARVSVSLQEIEKRVEKIASGELALPINQPSAEVENFEIPEEPQDGALLENVEAEDVLFNNGLNHFVENEFEQAIVEFEKLLDLYPDNDLRADTYFYLGEAQTKLEKWKEASEAFLNSFLEDNSGPRAPLTLLRLGQVFVSWERIEEACQMFNAVVERFPNTIEAQNSKNYISRFECNGST
ncbi:MAG: tetratricopeptide repeat protein [Rhodobacteraceae bacterium]|nr:tetratricopeptide repeat protein [Paracoccaceae bacterium]MYI92007.1 tetratricopeptide repeat protein [Paracoccaceae bacterium]